MFPLRYTCKVIWQVTHCASQDNNSTELPSSIWPSDLGHFCYRQDCMTSDVFPPAAVPLPASEVDMHEYGADIRVNRTARPLVRKAASAITHAASVQQA